MVNTIVWDGVKNPDFHHEEPFFSSLNFAVPIDKGRICVVLLESLLNWLLRPRGTVLAEGPVQDINGQVVRRVLTILVNPSTLYGPQGEAIETPTVGLGVIFKPPYMKHISFSQAYFLLSQWHLGHQSGIHEVKIMFVHLDSNCDLGPYVEPYPIWVNFTEKQLLEESQETFPVSWFRFFKLHQISIIPPERPDKGVVTCARFPKTVDQTCGRKPDTTGCKLGMNSFLFETHTFYDRCIS